MRVSLTNGISTFREEMEKESMRCDLQARRPRLLLSTLALVLGAMGLLLPASSWAAFGFQSGEQSFSLSTSKAGAHPDLASSFRFITDANGAPEGGSVKDVVVSTPPGFVGQATAVPTCKEADVYWQECSAASQVGELTVRYIFFGGEANEVTRPLYNVVPSGNAAAEFMANLAYFLVELKTSVRPGDYGLDTISPENPDLFPVTYAKAVIWGVPADHNGGGGARRALLTNPSVCGSPGAVAFSADSWQAQGLFATDSVGLAPFVGCASLPDLKPKLNVGPGAPEAGQPSGFDVDLEVPQVENPDGIGMPPVRKVVTSLPAGVHISPPGADGLEACTDAEAGFGSAQPVSCPDASKVGTISIETPALEKPLSGAMYVGEPKAGDRYRLVLVAEGPGVTIKLPGSVQADPATGQLTTTFDDTPQLPFSSLHVHLTGGSHALLANPSACGSYAATATLTPYGGGPAASAHSSFAIDQGCDSPGFSPGLRAGAVAATAGASSPFVLQVDRRDGEENLVGLDVTLPEGELAKLAGVPLCADAQASTGDCPPASQVGSVHLAVGAGSTPLWLPQPGRAPTAVYLAGPYKGAPYSLLVKVPAQAGPFDLGTVVTRAGIYLDPETTRVTVRSDPLPQMLEGVPIAYRTIHVDVDRPGFTLNPTSCEAMAVEAILTSTRGATANPSSRFQLGSCRDLAFAPKLGLRLRGKTTRGGHPALSATLAMPRHGANIARAVVALPHSEFLDQGHIATICTRVQFAAEECPAGSVYGHARAVTPLLDEPLEGPVYLRSSSHQLPDLVADLRGPIHVVLDGRIDSFHGGIRTTFATVPDAPVSTFTLMMRGGAKGLLQNSTDLCLQTHRASAAFAGHNGKAAQLHPALRIRCRARGRRGG